MVTLDASGDVSRQQLHRMFKLYGPAPSYAIKAGEAETLAPDGLPPTAYADPANRQFPLHTKSACYVSAMYFLNKRDQLQEKRAAAIWHVLLKAADRHGIRLDVNKLAERHDQLNSMSLDNLPDSSFAIVWKMASGRKDRHYPLRNGKEVAAAASWFVEHRDHWTFRDRCRIADKILRKAAEFSVVLEDQLDDLLQKQAARGTYSPTYLAGQIRKRAYLERVAPTTKDRMLKLASVVEKDPKLAEDRNSLVDIASGLDQFDRDHGLVTKYSGELIRPEDAVFAGLIKHAREFVDSACSTRSGSIYQRDQFRKLSSLRLREDLGSDIADSVTTGLLVDPEKMAEVVPTLPLNDAIVLDRLMRECGESPAMAKAGSAELHSQERAALAKEYRPVACPPEHGVLGNSVGTASH